jgi:hypothetical protein
MKKLVSLLGLLVAISLGAIAYIGLPVTDVMASQSQRNGCKTEIALDEGYGVSRHAPVVCDR